MQKNFIKNQINLNLIKKKTSTIVFKKNSVSFKKKNLCIDSLVKLNIICDVHSSSIKNRFIFIHCLYKNNNKIVRLVHPIVKK